MQGAWVWSLVVVRLTTIDFKYRNTPLKHNFVCLTLLLLMWVSLFLFNNNNVEVKLRYFIIYMGKTKEALLQKQRWQHP